MAKDLTIANTAIQRTSLAPTPTPLLRHVLRLPQQVPWTGQPGRTTGLERLGFYGDTWAAPRAGLRAALRAGLRAVLRTGPLGHATRRAAGPCYASGRRAALRVGPPGRATRRAAGRAARRTNYSATAPLDLRTNGRTTPIHTNGHRGPAPLESTAGFMYRTLGLRSGAGLGHAGVYYTQLDRTARAASSASTC